MSSPGRTAIGRESSYLRHWRPGTLVALSIIVPQSQVSGGEIMNLIVQSPRGSNTAQVLIERPESHRAARAASAFSDWAEDHWEPLVLTISVLCGVSLATILAVTFNILST